MRFNTGLIDTTFCNRGGSGEGQRMGESPKIKFTEHELYLILFTSSMTISCGWWRLNRSGCDHSRGQADLNIEPRPKEAILDVSFRDQVSGRHLDRAKTTNAHEKRA